MHEITADFYVLLELDQCSVADVLVPEIAPVTLGIVPHGFFQSLGNADVVDNQTACLSGIYTVYTRDSLHEVMPRHRLVNIHCGQ